MPPLAYSAATIPSSDPGITSFAAANVMVTGWPRGTGLLEKVAVTPSGTGVVPKPPWRENLNVTGDDRPITNGAATRTAAVPPGSSVTSR